MKYESIEGKQSIENFFIDIIISYKHQNGKCLDLFSIRKYSGHLEVEGAFQRK